jgi:DNA/RNA-binding domain of Phe-tRNA-synthetase-like protein
MMEASEKWKNQYPGAAVGVLVIRGAENPAGHPALDALGAQVEAKLRETYGAAGKQALKASPVIAAYEAYYKGFRKTYHVTAQLESVIWKGRGIPSVSAMVKAMFMAELSNMLLTAGHDLGKVALPLRVDVGADGESYIALGGEEKAVKEGDMRISDAVGTISSIIGGPDQRTAISPGTKDLLFTVYAPPGIGEELVRSHLHDIERFVKTVAPQASAEPVEICRAG